MSLDSGIEPGTAPIRVAQLIIDALASCKYLRARRVNFDGAPPVKMSVHVPGFEVGVNYE